jgi:Flp pilus assembly protein TadG
MKNSIGNLWTNTKGTIAVYFAVGAVPLIGLAAAANEIGVILTKENALQRAADAAAYSAARRLDETGSVETACDAAEASLEKSSLTSYRLPNDWCDASEDNKTVVVLLEDTMDRKMAALFRQAGYLVSTTSTAQIVQNDASLESNPCLLALSDSDKNAISRTSNGGVLNIGSCWMHSNSEHNQSIKVNSGFRTMLGCAQAHGGIKVTGAGSWDLECDSIRENQPKKSDPFGSISSDLRKVVEDRNSYGKVQCGGGSSSDSSEICTYRNESLGSDAIGFFPDGLKLDGNITLESGVYIVANSLEATKGAKVVGRDVTIMLLDDINLNIHKKADLELYAPTFGTFNGIVLTGQLTSSIGSDGSGSGGSGSGSDKGKGKGKGGSGSGNGGSGSSSGGSSGSGGNLNIEFKALKADINGALYFPQYHVKLGANTEINGTGTNNCAKIIAQTIDFSGNMNFYTSCSGDENTITLATDR